MQQLRCTARVQAASTRPTDHHKLSTAGLKKFCKHLRTSCKQCTGSQCTMHSQLQALLPASAEQHSPSAPKCHWWVPPQHLDLGSSSPGLARRCRIEPLVWGLQMPYGHQIRQTQLICCCRTAQHRQDWV